MMDLERGYFHPKNREVELKQVNRNLVLEQFKGADSSHLGDLACILEDLLKLVESNHSCRIKLQKTQERVKELQFEVMNLMRVMMQLFEVIENQLIVNDVGFEV